MNDEIKTTLAHPAVQAGEYPELPVPLVLESGYAPGDVPDAYTADQMRAYADATCEARAAAASKPQVKEARERRRWLSDSFNRGAQTLDEATVSARAMALALATPAQPVAVERIGTMFFPSSPEHSILGILLSTMSDQLKIDGPTMRDALLWYCGVQEIATTPQPAAPAQAAALVTPSDDGFMAAVNEMDGLYAAPLAITSAPERIWLDLGFNPYEDDVHFSNLHDLTWSQNNATGNGIEYVRADLGSND